MIAVDTNIVIRYLTGDHPKQSDKARALIEENDIFLSRTVVLECEWVLRSVYGYSALEVCEALRAFAGLPRVSVEDLGMVVQALDHAENGVGFADALHLAAANNCDTFVTFDQDFIKRAKRAGIDKVATA
ncbi:type II toxin-antitoxin system VapC family toxin [Taklimakanibacter deserti]|uniref:type II toxin-antitoxin system VapC family toxin n=1 Tax=Taklimakanibacter deserti TaxID=2267839 RepID=UPI000E654F8D